MQDKNKIKIVHTFVEFCGCGCGDGIGITRVFVNKKLVTSRRKTNFFIFRIHKLGLKKNVKFIFKTVESL